MWFYLSFYVWLSGSARVLLLVGVAVWRGDGVGCTGAGRRVVVAAASV